MACILTNGFSLGCKDSTGGIQEAYIANFSATTTYAEDSENVITGFTSPNTYFKIEQRNETGELLEEGNHSVENGTNFYTQTVNLILHKKDSISRNLIFLMAQAQMTVIVLDQNGKYWLLGRQNGADVTASSSNAGKAYGDLNGSTIGIEGKEPQPMFEISAAAFATLTIG